MLKVNEVIVVEGKYDKNTLSQLVDAVIIETSGFGIFKDREKLQLLRAMAKERGIVIMTDSDSAGFLIRNYLKGSLGGNVKHAYIPDVFGRERRKREASKEGKLGVEGMRPEVIYEALERAGVNCEKCEDGEQTQARLTKADMYALGLSGVSGSEERRAALKRRLGLPERLSSNLLLDVLNSLYTPEQVRSVCEDIFNAGGADHGHQQNG